MEHQEDTPLGYGLFLAASLRNAGVFTCNCDESTPRALNHAHANKNKTCGMCHNSVDQCVSQTMTPSRLARTKHRQQQCCLLTLPLCSASERWSHLSFKPCEIFISAAKGKLLIHMKQDPAAVVAGLYLLLPQSHFCGSHK